MLEIVTKQSFIKQLNNLDNNLVEEALEKINLFKDRKNHKILKVHKLHGSLSDCFSFYINYRIRIIFEYRTKTKVSLLAIGGHDVYNS